MITVDNYGFAVQIDNTELKNKIDEVITELENNDTYDDMIKRWLPKEVLFPKPYYKDCIAALVRE